MKNPKRVNKLAKGAERTPQGVGVRRAAARKGQSFQRARSAVQRQGGDTCSDYISIVLVTDAALRRKKKAR